MKRFRIPTLGFILGLTTLLISLLYFHNFQNIISGYFEKRSEIKIIKSIKNNYRMNKIGFNNLFAYLENCMSFPTITYLNEDNIECNLLSPNLKVDVPINDLAYWIENNNKIKKITSLSNGEVEMYYLDTILMVPNWVWTFVGNRDSFGYEFVLNQLNMTKTQIDSLRILLAKIDCEAISLDNKRDIRLRYDGNSMSQYEYIKTKKHYPWLDSTRIDENLYFCLNRSNIFCGTSTWQK